MTRYYFWRVCRMRFGLQPIFTDASFEATLGPRAFVFGRFESEQAAQRAIDMWRAACIRNERTPCVCDARQAAGIPVWSCAAHGQQHQQRQS